MSDNRERLIESLRKEAMRMAIMETGTLRAIELMEQAADMIDTLLWEQMGEDL
jgi:hypothetical protein